MGSGLVYAAVGLVWAWYAASRVAGARAGRRADQESSAQARVIRRAVVADPLDRTDETGASDRRLGPAVSHTDVPAHATPVAVPTGPVARVVPRAARRAAVRRRRTVLAVLVIASLGLGASTALGYLPLWAAAPAPVLCLSHLVAGARASRRSVSRPVTAELSRTPATADDPSWAGVHFVDVVADWCRTVPGEADHPDRADAHVAAVPDRAPGSAIRSEADRVEAARLWSASTPAVEDAAAGSWRAVPVPLPTYVTAPRVARTVKTIDLGSTGAWTSGRSAPSPIALPVAQLVTLPVGAAAEGGSTDQAVEATPPSVTPGGAVAVSPADVDDDTQAIELPHAASA